MFAPKELQDLLNFDMPHPNHQQQPDFTTNCHYTLRIYTCTHKSFLPSPRITHVSPCPYSPYSTNYPRTSNASKHRCKNMASYPKNVSLDEQCSKCRPLTLGTEKNLRGFEVLVAGGGGTDSGRDYDKKVEEVDRDLHASKMIKTEIESAPEPALPISNFLENEPVLEHSTTSTESLVDGEGKRKAKRWVDVCPSVDNGSPAPSVVLNRKSLLSRMFKPFAKSEEIKRIECVVEGKVGKEGKVGEEGVKDHGWEVVSNEEKKEKLWKDDGEWVNVKE